MNSNNKFLDFSNNNNSFNNNFNNNQGNISFPNNISYITNNFSSNNISSNNTTKINSNDSKNNSILKNNSKNNIINQKISQSIRLSNEEEKKYLEIYKEQIPIEKKEIKENNNFNQIKEKNPEDENTINKILNSKVYENILKNLNNDSYNKIKNTIVNIVYFDIEHPNLSDLNYSPIITNFNFNDLPISKKINNYVKEIVNNENENKIINKLKNFLNKKYFKYNFTNIDNNNKLLTFLKNNDKIRNHINNMNEIYQNNKDKLLKFEITNNNLNFENEYLNEFEYLEKDYKLIGNLQNFETFVYKYNVYDDIKLMVDAEKYIEYWREVYSDGNTFYRIFMFKLIENYITNNNIKQIQILFSNIINESYYESYDEKEIDKKKVFGIFELIIKYMNNNEIDKAYYLFKNSYKLDDGCFDNLLICYLKCVLYDNLNLIYDELKKEKLIKYFNIENIKKFYIEPEIIILYLIPYLFNVNLDLLLLDGDFSKPKYQIINFSEKNINKINIKIGSFYNTYFPLYDKNEINNNNIFQELISKAKNIKQFTFILRDKMYCQKCNTQTYHIFFIYKKFRACYECLIFYLNYQIKERAKNFQNEKFCNLEFYLRNIQLNEKNSVSDCEYIEIFENKNIYNKIVEEIRCLGCKKIIYNLKEYEIKILKCSCIYCEECFNMKKNNKLCKCGKKTISEKNLYDYKNNKNNNNNYNYNEKNNNDESLKDLNQKISTKCMKCLDDILIQKNDEMKYNSKYYNIIIKNENRNKNIEHIICKKCFNKIKKELKDEKLKKIECKICKQEHNFDGIKFKSIDCSCCFF